MRKKSIFRLIPLVVSITFFVSCDKDYNTIGDTLIGENHFELDKYSSNVLAYNQKTGPVQSNNLPINPLGIYDNPAFGKTSANFATQLTLASVNPTIGLNPEIESVYLDVPYFATLLETDVDGNHKYELDSIYGEPTAKIKLSVYESGYYMRDRDPVGGFLDFQNYYTNQNSDFNSAKVGSRLNDDADVAQNDAFFFDPKEHKSEVVDATTKLTTTTRTPPSMRLKLNNEFFKNRILLAPSGKLVSNEIFKDYLKGLYFKVEQSGNDPVSLAMINFVKGTITIKYKINTSSTDNTKIDATPIVLNLSGNTVSLPEYSNEKVNYTNAVENPNTVDGDEMLYLKGGQGSLAIIELFGQDLYGDDGTTGAPNGVADELDKIRKKGWLINQANLVFNIDTENVDFAKSHEPEWVYLYDFTNSLVTSDYYSYTGKITRDATSKKRGLSYKLNVTNHIRNLVKNATAKNVKLGIVVTQNIEIPDFYKLKTPTTLFSKIPAASVMNPLGTILYGGVSTLPDDKRLKLEIYYTKPN